MSVHGMPPVARAQVTPWSPERYRPLRRGREQDAVVRGHEGDRVHLDVAEPAGDLGPGVAAVGAAEEAERRRRHHEVGVVGRDGQRRDLLGDARAAAAARSGRRRRCAAVPWTSRPAPCAADSATTSVTRGCDVDAVDDGGQARPGAGLARGEEQPVVGAGEHLAADEGEGQHLAALEAGAEAGTRARAGPGARRRRRGGGRPRSRPGRAGRRGRRPCARRTARRTRRWRPPRCGRRRCCAPRPRRRCRGARSRPAA